MDIKKRKKGFGPFRTAADLRFYIVMIAFPVLQFLIFYIYVNFNSIMLAFKNTNYSTMSKSYNGFFENFELALDVIGGKNKSYGDLIVALKNSLLLYFVNFVCGIGLGLLFSFYISKKMPASGFFRVLLFMPSIVSAIVMANAYRYFTDLGLPEILHLDSGLFENGNAVKWTIIVYNVLVGFGTSVLMYSNAMSSIPSEVYEAAELDGARGIKEFWHISLPMIFSTLSTFIIAGIAGIFTNQMHLFSFYGAGQGVSDLGLTTYGYFIYNKSLSGIYDGGKDYPWLSAMGLCLTVIAVPLTLCVKKLLEKFGPSEV